MRAPLPLGTALDWDPDTVLNDDGSVFGGSPAKLMRFSAAGRVALAELRDGSVRTRAGAALGRRLSDAGVVHPFAGPIDDPRWRGSVTVVLPVRDRLEELDRCLKGLTVATGDVVARVLVVDDASLDREGVAEVVARHGAELVRRERNGGPGAARNTGLQHVRTPFVAFCDSDCEPPPAWIAELVGHFTDPLVAAAAPRIVGLGSGRRSTLDLGDRAARVSPLTRVSYVPTAALLLRVAALEQVAGVRGFDPALRYGEDVDLVWRLLESGARVRYDPSVQVGHSEPARRQGLMARRFAYGTSAAPLEDRHPGQVAPLVLVAAPAAVVAAVLARRPGVAVAAFAAGYLDVALTLRRAGRPARGILAPLARGSYETFFGVGRWTTQFAAPLAVAAAVAPVGRRRGRAVMVAALVLAPPLREWRRTRPAQDPVRHTLGTLLDEAAYGAGVWTGSLRAHHLRAVLPRWRWHLMKTSPPPRD